MSGCCIGNVDNRGSRQSTVPSVKPAGRRADGEINRLDKLVVDPGRFSSGRGVRFPPVSTISKLHLIEVLLGSQHYGGATLSDGAAQDCAKCRCRRQGSNQLRVQIKIGAFDQRPKQPSRFGG
jgi:hypothetical protein